MKRRSAAERRSSLLKSTSFPDNFLHGKPDASCPRRKDTRIRCVDYTQYSTHILRRIMRTFDAKGSELAKFIHLLKDWPSFTWDNDAIMEPLAAVRFRQGVLLGKVAALGFPAQDEATLDTLTL